MILAAGLSPAWQQILTFDSLNVGEVNRAREAVWCASGKVINVAMAVHSLQSQTLLLTAIGGISGEVIQQEMEAYQVPAQWVTTSAATRVCTTLLNANGQTTELVENIADIDEEGISEFTSHLQVGANVADITVITGSQPANVPADLFARTIQHTHKRFILDLRGEALDYCLQLHPFLIKPNREELQATLKRSLESDEELVKAMLALNLWGVRWVVVSDGARGVWVTSEDTAVHLIPPPIQVVNPIGCGDSLAAGIACALEKDDDVIAAVRFGMGAAANNAENLLPARLDLQRTTELANRVSIEQVEVSA